MSQFSQIDMWSIWKRGYSGKQLINWIITKTKCFVFRITCTYEKKKGTWIKIECWICYIIKTEITSDHIKNVNWIGKNKSTLVCQIHRWVKRVTYCHPLLGPLNTEQVGHGPNHAAPATQQKQKWRLKSAHLPWLETQQVKLWITCPDHLPETPAVHAANNEAPKWNWETDTETKHSKYLCIWQNDSKIHQTNALVGWLRRE